MAETKRDAIARTIRTDLSTGRWSHGEPLPSENQLSAELGATRGTVHAALANLVSEGLIKAQQGAGYTVVDRQPIECHRGERHGEDGPTDVHIRFADGQDAQLLGITRGEEVLVRKHLRVGDGGNPIEVTTTIAPRSLTKETVAEDPDTSDAVSVLAGKKHVTVQERVMLRRADTAEASILRIPASTACLRVERVTRTKSRVLAVEQATCIDRCVLIYDLPAR